MSRGWFDNQAFGGASAHSRLRVVYVGALLLIGVLALAGGAVTAAGIARSEPLAAAVHLSGRQRVHSQLLTKAALQLAVGLGESDVLRGRMRESIERLRSVHAALRDGDAGLGVPADLPRSFHARLDQLRPTLDKLLAKAEVLAAMDPPESANGPVLQKLLAVERALVPQLEAAVVQLSEHARSVSMGMHQRVQWLGVACVAVLAAVGLLVFEPATRVIARQVGEIDRQRRLAEQLARDAQAADRAKTAFLANMSHEIRTPLAAMLGYADMLREDGDLALAPLSRLQHLDRMSGAGRQLLTLMDGILDMSRLQAEAMSIREGPLDVADVVREVERATVPSLVGRPVTLACTAEGGATPGLLGDADRVRQILMTLLSNACKFTLKGRVSLRVRLEAAGDWPTLVAEVEDTGVGMSPDQARIIFQPFSQADESVTRRFGGVGMGLSVARRLAQLMGGDITLARTAPGEGSVFVARIPLRRAGETVGGGAAGAAGAVGGQMAQTDKPATLAAKVEHPPAPAAVAKPRPAADVMLKGRVLLVEDGPDNQRIIAFHLRKAGLEVTVAENGRAALAAMNGQSFDLIVSDMQMPEMDGYSLARHLREQGNRVPIIALTAHAMVGDRERCLAAGCSDYLVKPASKQALVGACAMWLAAGAGDAAAAGQSPVRVADAAKTEGQAKVDEKAATVPEAVAVGDSPLKGRVLLVEDGPDNQRIIAFHLRKAGLEVTIAENGRVALEVMAGRSFDLIVSDMQMPEMDGYSLARHLRERGSRVPIIALTAHAMVGDRERCLAAGCSDYLAKPVSKQALVGACATWLAAAAGKPAEAPTGAVVEAKAEVASAATAEARADAAAAPAQPVTESPLKGRVLLVEDGPDNQRIIAFHLRKAGLEVTIVENGRVALEAMHGQSFDLIVSDMQMPEMDGYSLANHLRLHGNRVPIIALTAHAMVGDRERCLAAGCSDYLAKPVSKQALVAACRTWLAAGAGARAGAPAQRAA